MPNAVMVTVSGKNESQRATTAATQGVADIGQSATRTNLQYNRLLDTIGRTDQISRKAVAGAESSLDRFDDSVQRSERHVKDLADAANDGGGRLSHALGEQASGAADGLMDALGPIGGVLGKLGPVGMAAGAAIGVGLLGAKLAVDRLREAVGLAIERAQSAGKAGAQLGLDTPQQVKDLGRIAGKVYADNFTASIEDASKAVRDVLRNHLVPEDATDDAIKRVTEKLATVADLFEDDTAHVSTAVSTLLRTGLAKSADEALDVLTRGLQEGADKSQDLIDTLVEYPTEFRRMGLSAQEATGILVQGLRAGARNSDVVADAIKEFAIRAVDGSKTTADGFKRLGLSAKTMAADLAAGGDRANKALDTTLDRLRAVKDPVERAQIAVELFGTKAEDLGDALFALDPSTAAANIGKLEGASDRAAAAIGDNLGSRIEGIQRKFEQWRADMGDKLVPIIDRVIDKLRDIWQWVGPMLQDALDFLKQQVDDNREGLEDFGEMLKDLEPILKVLVAGAIAIVAGSLGLLIKYIAIVGDDWTRMKDVFRMGVVSILELFGQLLDGAVEAFGWVPGIGPKLKEAQARFHEFAADVTQTLEGIPDQQINIDVKLRGVELVGSLVADAVGARMVSQGLGARHAAGGPTGGGVTVMNELGVEAVRLPTGSTVIPHGQTAAMLDNAQGGGGLAAGLVPVTISGSRWVAALVDEIASEVRKRGGKAAVIGLKAQPST